MIWQAFAAEADLHFEVSTASIRWYVMALAIASVLTLAILVVLFFGRSRRSHDD